jgi:SAM-dependent methyltransferase
MPYGLTIMLNHTSSTERDHNFENIRIATSPENGDSQVRSDPTDDEDPSILGLAASLEDGDSQFDSHSASDMSPTTSANPSIFEFLEENGRTYHKFEGGRYPLPNDEEERNRLDLQHHLFLLTLKQKLFLCPVDLRTTHRVLDLGTGTGIWALDFGAQNPHSHVLGIDLSPIQPEWIVPNVQFIVDDIEAIVFLSIYSSYHLFTNFSVAI